MRYAEYTGMPGVIEPIASNLGIKLSKEALLAQSLLAGMVAVLDDTIDNGSPGEADTALDYWRHLALGTPLETDPDGIVNPQLIQDTKALHDLLSPSQARDVYGLGNQVIRLSNRYATESNIYEYHRLRSEEAGIAFEMMARVVPEEEQAVPAFSRYVELARTTGVIIGAMDSVKDLREDAREGRTAIPPSLKSHAILLKLALAETVAGIRELGYGTTHGMYRAGTRHGYEIEKLHYLHGIRHTQ